MHRMYFAIEEEALEYFDRNIKVNFDECGCYVEVLDKEDKSIKDTEENECVKEYVIACYPNTESKLYLSKSGVTYNLVEAKHFDEKTANKKLKFANIKGTYKWFKVLVN